MLTKITPAMLLPAVRAQYPLMPSVWHDHMANLIVKDLDPRLEINAAEWIAHRPLTEIWFQTKDGRRFSVNSVMAVHGNQDVIDALLAVNLLAQGNEELAMTQIYRTLK